VAKLKYPGITLKNQNLILEEIKSRLNPENCCYHSVQNSLPSCLLSINAKIKILKILIFPVVLFGCKIWSLTLKKVQTEGMGEQGAEENVCIEDRKK
jgi:hypothetical protein